MANELNINDFEDKIDEWHEMPDKEFDALGQPALWEYLGMTWEEYKSLVERKTGGLF